jgi:WD40 repeat protein
MTGKQIAKFIGHRGRITTLGFSPDGHVLFSGASDKQVLIWNTANPNSKTIIKLTEHEAAIRAISLSADGSSVYVIDFMGNAYIWDAKTGQIRIANPNWTGKAGIAAFDHQGRFALIGKSDGSITLWDVDSARNLVELRGKGGAPVSTMLWMKNSVAIGDHSGNLTVFDLQNKMLSMSELTRIACSNGAYNDTTFKWMEVAADPLIREIWDPKGIGRKICE